MNDINIQKIKIFAKTLIEDSDNIEYARGICELIAEIDGIPEVENAERASQIAIELNYKYNIYYESKKCYT